LKNERTGKRRAAASERRGREEKRSVATSIIILTTKTEETAVEKVDEATAVGRASASSADFEE